MLWALLAVFAGQFVKGVTGFGSALVAVPVLAWVWGPAEAVVLMACLDTVSGLVLAASVWRRLEPLLVLGVFAAILPGQWMGTGLLTTLPAAQVALVLGVLVALFGARLAIQPVQAGRGELEALPEDVRPVAATGLVAGLASGVMQGLTGVGGPPLVAFMKHWFVDHYFRAQLIGIFALGAAAMVFMCGARGLLGPETLWRVAPMLPLLVVGNLVGARVAARLPRVRFAQFVGLLLVGSGLALALKG